MSGHISSLEMARHGTNNLPVHNTRVSGHFTPLPNSNGRHMSGDVRLLGCLLISFHQSFLRVQVISLAFVPQKFVRMSRVGCHVLGAGSSSTGFIGLSGKNEPAQPESACPRCTRESREFHRN